MRTVTSGFSVPTADGLRGAGLGGRCLSKAREAVAEKLKCAGEAERSVSRALRPSEREAFKNFFEEFLRESLFGAMENADQYVSDADLASDFLASFDTRPSVVDSDDVKTALGDVCFEEAGAAMTALGVDYGQRDAVLSAVAEAACAYAWLASVEANAKAVERELADAEHLQEPTA